MKKDALERGFSLIEFIGAMTLLVFLFVAAMSLFVPLLKHSKAEGGIAQSQIEGIVGLELLRTDIVHAGHGLPWVMGGLTYTEGLTGTEASAMNDGPSNPPRAIDTINNANPDDPDYLTIKANNVDSVDTAAQKVSYIQKGDGTTYHRWYTPADPELDFVGTEYVSLIRLVDPSTGIPLQLLNKPGTPGQFFMLASEVSAPPDTTGFANEMWYIFGLTESTEPKMPFNRADYILDKTNSIQNPLPTRCLSGTGVLIKRVVDQANGTDFQSTRLPLLDCVADFQVAFGVDTTTIPDGKVDCYTNDLASITTPAPLDLTPAIRAETIRERVGEVRIYILAQEGVFDWNYDFTGYTGGATNVRVGELNADLGDATRVPPLVTDCSGGLEPLLGQDFDMTTLGAAANDHKDYRWKVYRFVVHPENLTYSLIGAAQGAK